MDSLGCSAHGSRRPFSREPETSGSENIVPDSVDRPASGCPVVGSDADAPPVPQQAATVELQWSGGGDARQRAASLCTWATAAFQKPQQIRGLNQNHNHEMKRIFKSTAQNASRCAG